MSQNSVLNPDRELLVIGIIYTVLSAIVFPVYVLIIHALHSRHDLRENISYKLINLLNYCDVSQAFCHLLTGIFLIFPVFISKVDFFVRVSLKVEGHEKIMFSIFRSKMPLEELNL
ncbi:Protein CBG08693 [Caenorhabditis briggsae]|uniref:Protein CBG08693 n=1 Tax=Caenorhabditis briggsae TaxID=6238 RepID=A8X6S8_CAEBR|nr:Protein CBG08693 [Caenorhabditis briggsae]CAP28339.2 Protein CBG08693 [Caenorhabditis briggsae]